MRWLHLLLVLTARVLFLHRLTLVLVQKGLDVVSRDSHSLRCLEPLLKNFRAMLDCLEKILRFLRKTKGLLLNFFLLQT